MKTRSDRQEKAAALAAQTRPCPFCGGPARVRRHRPSPPDLLHTWWTVTCPEKNACTVWPMASGDSRHEALANWNTRVPEQTTVSRMP